MTTAPGRYALDNAHEGAPGMHECLSGVLDTNTTDLLVKYLSIADGALRHDTRTLLLGAGNGSMALKVADEISYGAIVVLDLDTSRIRPEVRDHHQVEVITCDLLAEPLPPGPWDLVHARLLFAHLPNRDKLLLDVVDTLAPGGTLMIEDWGVAGPGLVLDAPSPRTKRLFQRYQQALIAVFADAGNDPRWATRTHAAMRDAGLVDVETHTRARSWTGGSPGCQLPIAVSTELEDRLVTHGLTRSDLDELRHDLTDPRVVLTGNLTWSTIGRTPLED
ncbi:methyltransferase domain-containing protein [Virgisporangium ochraceum]|uniref:Methyltransferase n=1 Tax=Virgisporangium ochraceum TaxID=65505 RepID=A0A8J4EFY2_9ACTN|nr:methyltransferase [Virgisporangium ochraceum]GIJ74140.1 methyltransferase [Virgisporangium ochraceum]